MLCTVSGAPVFTNNKPMRHLVVVPAARSVRLKCPAAGIPKPNITWWKDNVPFVKRVFGQVSTSRWKPWVCPKSLGNLVIEWNLIHSLCWIDHGEAAVDFEQQSWTNSVAKPEHNLKLFHVSLCDKVVQELHKCVSHVAGRLLWSGSVHLESFRPVLFSAPGAIWKAWMPL